MLHKTLSIIITLLLKFPPFDPLCWGLLSTCCWRNSGLHLCILRILKMTGMLLHILFCFLSNLLQTLRDITAFTLVDLVHELCTVPDFQEILQPFYVSRLALLSFTLNQKINVIQSSFKCAMICCTSQTFSTTLF